MWFSRPPARGSARLRPSPFCIGRPAGRRSAPAPISVLSLTRSPGAAAHLAPLAGRGPHGKTEKRDSARGPLHDSEPLRLVEGPPHPDLLPARGEKETACAGDRCETNVR